MCERPQFDYVLPWCDSPPVSDLIYRHTPLTGAELSVDLAQWPNHKPPQLHANIVKDTNNMHTHMQIPQLATEARMNNSISPGVF